MDREKLTVRSASHPAVPSALKSVLRRLPAYVYLDDVFRGRHVLEVGCGEGAAAHHLARAGAASVIALDRSAACIEAARARYRVGNLSFGVSEYDSIDLEDHAIDVICVPGGEELARWPAFLQEARRVMARDGTLVVVAASADRPNGRGVGFHDLASRLQPQFGPPRMIGVTPFVGFSLVEYADTTEVLDIELDSSLVELGTGRDPITDYVAVCGSMNGPARGYMVVELPPGDGLEAVRQAHQGNGDRPTAPAEHVEAAAAAPPAEVEAEGPGDLKKRLSRAVEERTGAEAEVAALRTRLGQAEEEIGRVAAQAARELGEARRALHVANAHGESLEAQLAEARRGHEMRGDLERLQRELAGALERAARAGAERHELVRKLADLEAQLRSRDDELSTLRLETAPLEVMVKAAEQHEAEMRDRLSELAERDAYVEEMRQELEDVALAERAAADAARDASLRAAELEAEVRELRGRLSVAEGELLRLRSREIAAAAPDPRVAELEAALAEKAAAADKATARWKETEGKTDELWKKIGEMQKELAAAREQAVENARAQRQAAQIALTRAVDEASKKLVSAQDQSIRTERERAELERELTALRPRLLDLEREREALRAELARSNGLSALGELEAQLAGVKDALRAEEQTLEELSARLGSIAAALPSEQPAEGS